MTRCSTSEAATLRASDGDPGDPATDLDGNGSATCVKRIVFRDLSGLGPDMDVAPVAAGCLVAAGQSAPAADVVRYCSAGAVSDESRIREPSQRS